MPGGSGTCGVARLVDAVEVAFFVREGVNVGVGYGVRVGRAVRIITPNSGVADFVPGFSMMIGLVPLLAAVFIKDDVVFVADGLLPEDELEDVPEAELFVPCWAVTTKTGAPDGLAIEPGSGVSASSVEMPGSVPIKRYLKGVAVSGAGTAGRFELNRPISNTSKMPRREKTPSRIGISEV